MKILLAVVLILVVVASCTRAQAQSQFRATLLSRELRAEGLYLRYLVESAAPPVVADGAALLAQATVGDGSTGYRSTIAVRVGCGGALAVVVAGEQVVIERRWCGLLPVAGREE